MCSDFRRVLGSDYVSSITWFSDAHHAFLWLRGRIISLSETNMDGPSAGICQSKRQKFNVKIGDTAQCLKGISSAIAKRAYEIYVRRGSIPGHEGEDWQLAEKEVLQPICACGILESKDAARISMTPSAFGENDGDIEEIEICAEPTRLILRGSRGGQGRLRGTAVYRVLPLAHEFDPSSIRVQLKQHGGFFEIEIRKAHKDAQTRRQAA